MAFYWGEIMDKDYLEKVYEAFEKINELTGIAPTQEDQTLLSTAYNALDELLSPVCPECKVKAKRFITSPARLYDPAMAEVPGGTRIFWTGEWYCPKCQCIVAYGRKWWKKPWIKPNLSGVKIC